MSTVDLRSDTVTKPTSAMMAAMTAADVGDDVYGEDPTVNALESMAAELTGHEAALFVSSGTQGNLLGIMSRCDRGDEYIVGQTAHTYRVEGGGAAVLGSIQPQPLDQQPDGTLDLDAVRAAIKPDDAHFARSRLFCLENTTAGKVLPMDYLRAGRALADETNLGYHLDGARVFNAAVKLGVPVKEITSLFDTVSICLSKGLGAPVGSVLVGNADNIKRARRWRKVVGGGMRQAGFLAAAGMHALEHHVARLAEDHALALRLAEGLRGANRVSVDVNKVQTNMVFMEADQGTADELAAFLAERGIRIKASPSMRLVTHLDIDEAGIDRVVQSVHEFGAQ